MRAKLWRYPGKAGWCFLTLSKKKAAEIKKKFGVRARGWGSLPVKVTIGDTSWKTSIFPDKRSGSYLLPVKAAVRKKEGIEEGDMVSFELEVKF